MGNKGSKKKGKHFVVNGLDYGPCDGYSDDWSTKRIFVGIEPHKHLRSLRIYEGEVEVDDEVVRPHGRGRLFVNEDGSLTPWNEGTFSVGFVHGKMTGMGTFSCEEPSRWRGVKRIFKYVGEMTDFGLNGTFNLSDSDVPFDFKGVFIAGKPSGAGRLVFNDSLLIEGDFIGDGQVRKGTVCKDGQVLASGNLFFNYMPDQQQLVVNFGDVQRSYDMGGRLIFEGRATITATRVEYVEGSAYVRGYEHRGLFNAGKLLDGYVIQDGQQLVRVIDGVHHLIREAPPPGEAPPSSGASREAPPPSYSEAPPSYSEVRRMG